MSIDPKDEFKTQKPTISSTDWQEIYKNIYTTNKANKFVNYRYNMKTSVRNSYSGCIGTDEDNKPLISTQGSTSETQGKGLLCDMTNYKNNTPCKVDTNLHSPDTCKLTVGLIDSQKKFDKYSSGKSVYYPGLSYTVYYGTMRDNYDLFFAQNPRVWFNGVSTSFRGLSDATGGRIVENVDAWGGGYTGGGIPGPNTSFTIEWVGYFRAPEPGIYTFLINSDDASLMYIDDGATNPHYYGSSRNVFIDNGNGHGMITRTMNSYQAFDNTTYHPIRIRYEEGGGGYNFIFQILDSKNKEISASTTFYKDPASSTYYSLVRNSIQPNMYDCYMTNNEDTVTRSMGRQYLYRTLKYFNLSVDGKQLVPKASMYAVVGDDGSIQLCDAAKSGQNIDFNRSQVRDGNHPDFIVRLNGRNGEFMNSGGMNYIIQSDGNMRGDAGNGSGYQFLSWQNWLNYPNTDPPGLFESTNKARAKGAFTWSQDDYIYNSGNPFSNRCVIAHKNNPYNKTGKHYAIIGEEGNYKFRMNDQGDLRLIYAVSGCESADNNGSPVKYTQDTNVYAFYNVSGDPRINKSFYFDSSDNTMNYIDKTQYPDLYVNNPKGSDYSSYQDIYLPSSIQAEVDKNPGLVKKGISQDDCQSLCNSSENCNYYYYQKTADNSSQCYVDNGTFPYQFTPSKDPSGGTAEWIQNNKGSLNVKEKTIFVNPSLLTGADGTDPNVIQTDYNAYNNTRLYFQPGSFYNKMKPGTAIYSNSDLKSVVVDEINYYYNGGNGEGLYNGKIYDPKNVTKIATPAGAQGFTGSMSESLVEGFKEGVEGGVTSLQKQSSSSGDNQNEINSGYDGNNEGSNDENTNSVNNSEELANHVVQSLEASNDEIPSMDVDGKKLTQSVNANPWITYRPPISKMMVASNAKGDVAFYNAVYDIIKNVKIHLPMYDIERDAKGRPCVKNRGTWTTNYQQDGMCPNGYKVVLTQADKDDPQYNKNRQTDDKSYGAGPRCHAYLFGDSGTLVQPDGRMQFGKNCFQFARFGNLNPGVQWLRIEDRIEWPNNYLTFSFYFKLSPNRAGDKTGWPRIFDFSNGPGRDNIMVCFYYDGSLGTSLRFGCLGYDVYGRPNAGANDSGVWYESFFENVDDDKWHFCEWKIMAVGGIPSPNPRNSTKGLQITWQLALHTLQSDGSITAEYITIFDSTFSNFKDRKQREYDRKYRNEMQYKCIDPRDHSRWDGGFRVHPDAYIVRNDTQQTIGGRTYLDFYNVQTRDYVWGYDNICLVQTGSYTQTGSIWYCSDCNKNYYLKMHPAMYNTCRMRLSIPYNPTTQNYIGNSPWGGWDRFERNVCCLADFKMIVNQPTIWTETTIPGSFNWCYFTPNNRWQVSIKNAKPVNGWPQVAWNAQQMWMHQPVVDDGDSGFFKGSTLPSQFKSKDCPMDPAQITIYQPDRTNNMANFIYSQIIYPGSLADTMLKPYLSDMAKIRKENFQNIEGFTFSEGFERDDILGKDRNPSTILMDEQANNMNTDTNVYARSLQQLSTNTGELQNYLRKYQADYNSIKTNINSNKDDEYDYDSGKLLYYNNKDTATLRDVKISDNQQFIIQQNTVYIIGTITCASMILAAIILARQ
jgi:hypothetical protein